MVDNFQGLEKQHVKRATELVHIRLKLIEGPLQRDPNELLKTPAFTRPGVRSSSNSPIRKVARLASSERPLEQQYCDLLGQLPLPKLTKSKCLITDALVCQPSTLQQLTSQAWTKARLALGSLMKAAWAELVAPLAKKILFGTLYKASSRPIGERLRVLSSCSKPVPKRVNMSLLATTKLSAVESDSAIEAKKGGKYREASSIECIHDRSECLHTFIGETLEGSLTSRTNPERRPPIALKSTTKKRKERRLNEPLPPIFCMATPIDRHANGSLVNRLSINYRSVEPFVNRSRVSRPSECLHHKSTSPSKRSSIIGKQHPKKMLAGPPHKRKTTAQA